MRISRQSISRRRRLVNNVSRAVSRARRDGCFLLCVGRFLLFVASSMLFGLSSNFLMRSSNNKNNRLLRSMGPVRPAGTKPIPAPLPPIEPKQFKPEDFRTKNISLPDASIILFYNLFIPWEFEGSTYAIEVITEQMGQVASSLRKLEKGMGSAALFYNLIGNGIAFPEEKMKALCSEMHSGLSCQQIGYYDTASESVTLQDIYDFCQNKEAVDAQVAYLHSKGSYHQTEVNTYWRRALTDAVVHPDCLFPPDDRCNTCGAQFYTRFSTMYPGNMWTAKCSYVKKLLPPLEGGEYDQRKEESIVKFLKYRLWGVLDSTLLEDRVDYFGLGRYRLEHWIGSHPSIEPCDLHRKDVPFERMITGNMDASDYEWGTGPRRYEIFGEVPDAKERIAADEDAQFREYFFLPGNLLKWFTLYGSEGVPSQSSWAFQFFPAGDKWKKLVRDFGENAIEEMAMQSTHGFHSAYSFNNAAREGFEIEQHDEKLFSESNSSPIVVFYHISIPHGKEKASALNALKSQLDVLSLGQYDIISRSYHRQRPVILYYSYSIAGNSTVPSFFTKACNAKPKHLTCQKLGEFPYAEANNGETLRHLHNFCIANPSQSVTYLSNTLPRVYGVNKTEALSIHELREHTTAATSKMCLKKRDKCNVCSSEFYPLPFHHFVGNVFTASCNYVKDLLPPEKFEKAMNAAAGDTLVSQLRGAVTTDLFQFTPQTLGLEQYSVEHWIGSHPDFEPCDVAPVRHSWFPLFTAGSYLPNDFTSSRAYDFMWSPAPRRSSAPVDLGLTQEKEKKAMEADGIVFREYYYLAGNLFRWFKLYKKAPPQHSWVWQWYPKGTEWMKGTETHGSNVVTKLSKPFWDDGVPF